MALTVVFGDGYMQTFGLPNLRAKIILAPHLPGTAGELLAERYIAAQLKGGWRDLYMPGLVRATGMYRQITAATVSELLAEIEFSQELDKIAQRLRGAA